MSTNSILRVYSIKEYALASGSLFPPPQKCHGQISCKSLRPHIIDMRNSFPPSSLLRNSITFHFLLSEIKRKWENGLLLSHRFYFPEFFMQPRRGDCVNAIQNVSFWTLPSLSRIQVSRQCLIARDSHDACCGNALPKATSTSGHGTQWLYITSFNGIISMCIWLNCATQLY